jgi:tRNA A-37 threonylcarbamoyl transferase component Bud32
MIELLCPHCGDELLARDESAGQRVKCPNWGGKVAVAAGAPAEPPGSETATLPPSAPPNPAEAETIAPAAGIVAELPLPWASALPEVPGYEILRELGRGGMAVVYKARQSKLNRLVALKMILTGAHAGEAELARFRTEAEAIARLQHPNIVQVYEVGEHAGLPYLALELCAGGSLEKKLNGTPLPPREAAELVEKLAQAMHVAHGRGVIHRDLKPANVLLAEDGTPKVTDFGLAKKLDEAGQTATGAVMGTPSYMAPEQAGGKPVGPLADVYALGAILYECLTGRPPFRAATALDTILQVVTDEPAPPSLLAPQVPRDLETICLKCLRKDPTKRYASAQAMADDLRRFQAGEPIAARRVGRLERAWKWAKRRPTTAALLAVSVSAGLAAVGIVAGVAILVYRQNQDLTKERDRVLVAQMKGRKEHSQFHQAIGDLAPHVDADGARKLVPLLVRAAHEEPDASDRAQLARAVAELARHMSKAEAAQVCTELARPLLLAIPGEINAFTRAKLGRAVAALAGHMEYAEGAKVCAEAAAPLLGAIVETTDVAGRAELGQALAALAGRMDWAPAEKLSSEAALWMVDAIPHESNAPTTARGEASKAVAALAPRMDAAGARAAAERALDLMPRTANTAARARLAEAVLALTGRVDGDAAGPLCAGAALSLVPSIAGERDLNNQSHMALTVKALAERMDAAGARAACRAGLDVLPQAVNAPACLRTAQAMAALTSRLQPAEAAQLSGEAVAVLVRSISRGSLVYVVTPGGDGPQAVLALAPQLDTAGARTACRTALDLIAETRIVNARVQLAQVIVSLAPRLDGSESAQLCAGAAAVLVQAIPGEKSAAGLAHAVAALAVHMEPAQAAKLCAEAAAPLVRAIPAETSGYSRATLGKAVAALAAHLDAAGSAQHAVPTVKILFESLKVAKPVEMPHVARAAGAVAEWVAPHDLAELLARHPLPPAAAEALLRELEPLACRRFDTLDDAARWFRAAGSAAPGP